MNGTYIEYFCLTCGWFPSIKITKENEKVVRKLFEKKVKDHQLSHRPIK